ncbi:hypothetical protein DDZ13_11165 [Coraliomargarita sinensis]|uniref:DUF1961 domain-containing protein n=1 Tax=Coraliomargarita sinensis TaxID=2174842 RepID=A0A317ZDW7_9BACT|nr:DUF1961 family protein [Coraliomargarita sinensis]PXA03535.1 hypothetical protein DDZ13_11165 [Coraliomargarita sinensis]
MKVLNNLLPAFMALSLTACASSEPAAKSSEQLAFEQADQRDWASVFTDLCTGDWTEQWFLDGEVGTVTTNKNGMKLQAGPEWKNDAHHMVLWTKESFEGDLKIEYDFTRTETDGWGVIIIYIQATGSGAEGFPKDITEWNDYRRVPKMSKYFRGMNTYHISYATSYIRGRRYMPLTGRMNGHSEMVPDYTENQGPENIFEPGVTYRMTIIKTDRVIYIKAASEHQTRYFKLTNEKYPIITEGRIGLRHMYTRAARYKNFSVSVPK